MKFSDKLKKWLKSKSPKTLSSLDDTFNEKSFAVAFLLLMALAALPIPTGGITHVLELINMLVALELIIGLHTLWLPKRWKKMRIGKVIEAKALPKFIGFISWLERFSRPRLGSLFKNAYFPRLLGIVVLVFTISAFIGPPFSGLDTLPAMGVVLISLSVLLEDVVIFGLGLIAGGIGITLQISLGSFVLRLFN